ncbi:MAG: DNA mismatch repair endonuclease MutL [Clostridia bacterium]|nr:DNA mismatch repair endonuclease MutL [Clostridia bacterium]
MSKISRLPESTYKRIAAGEVIVGPAAAVKELMENALDAGATSITVETVEGGRDLIRVTDNGCGMSPEDLAICADKHATSKIGSFEEVYALTSLGFRGEALASIAEVARLTISSRERGAPTGAELSISGGGEPQITEAGLPEGTTVRINDLFYNVPARRKFLKTAAREAAAVTETVRRLILSRPDVAIKYIRNNHIVYQTPGSVSLRQAASLIYGPEALSNMVDVSFQGQHASVSGIVSKPTYIFKTPQRMEFYLNGRSVESKALQKAVMQGYQGSILNGHHPACVLHIETDPGAIDINIHPAKLSVLLFQEEDVVRDVAKAVSEAALAKVEPPKLRPASQQPEAADYDQPLRQPNFWMNVSAEEYRGRDEAMPDDATAPPALPAEEEEDVYAPPDFSLRTGQEEPEPVQEPADLRTLEEYSVLGTVFETYILCEAGDVLYLIDQHAAQERLTYESLLDWQQEGGRFGQLLLLPVMKVFSQPDYDLLMEYRSFLETLGIRFEPFGELTLRFVSFPVQVTGSETEAFVDSLLEELRDHGSDSVVARDRIITQACRHSVKAGTPLNDQETARLVGELVTSEAIPHCPHGRPVAVALTKADLEKGFKRRV